LTAGGIIDTSSASNVTLGNLANLHITGGSSGYTIKTDGAGNLSWGVDTAAAGGANTYVQFNDGDVLNGSANYTFDKVTNQLTLAGNIQTNNANLGNSVTANYFTGNFYGRANTANTVLIAAQPNITSVGTLTGLTVSGVTSLGPVSNVSITGGTNLSVLTTDGTGTLTWGAVVTTPPGGSNTSIQYKDGSTYQGSANLTFNDATNLMTVTGNIQTNNANLGNLTTSNYFAGTLTTAAQPNITSVGTLAGLTVSSAGLIVSGAGNVNAGNITATGVFAGNGANLTTLTGSNVTGTVANATYATNSAALLTTLTTTGTVFIPFISATANGNYAHLSNANFSANLANGAITATTFVGALSGAATSATTAGTVTTAAQPNITSVGTLTSLGVSGTITAPAFTANTGVFTGNGSGLSALTFGNITTFNTAGLTTDELYLQGTTRLNVSNSGASYLFDQYGATTNPALYVTSGETLAFNLNITGHPFLIQTGAGANYSTGLSHVSTAGTVLSDSSAQGQVAGTLYWKVPYGITGNYKYQCSIHGGMNGNIVVTDANIANITVGTATRAGTVTTAAQPNITSVGTLTSLAVTGNISAGNVSATTFTGSLSGAATSATTAGTVTTAAQPNITSTGTLTSMTSTGNVQGANVIATAYHIRSVGTGITAAGTTQGAGTVLSKEINIVSTVASGANAVVLPTAVAGMVVNVTNTTANAMLVFPASGAQINSLGTNLSFSQSTTTIQFIAPSSTQWYTVGATYA
jgi:plastocyanin